MGFKSFTRSVEQLRPDPRYQNRLIAKFINCLMYEGKKSVAMRQFYGALDIIAKKVKDAPPLDVFTAAIENVKPHIEVRSKRVGGATYQVPMQVNQRRRLSLAIRWILDASRAKKGSPFADRLSDELLAAFKKEGTAIQTRENVHRMAEANKAFAHFAW